MKSTLVHLTIACIAGVATIGCDQTKVSDKKSETTVTAPGGTTTKSVEEKVETSPDSVTKTTTEKIETTGENPPPAAKQ